MFRLEFKGQEYLPHNKAYILAPNHASNLDPLLVGVGVPTPIRFMAHQGLFANVISRWILQKWGAFPVRRGRYDKRALDKAFAILKRGGTLLLFPEGFRTHDGQIGHIKPGIAVLAMNQNIPIIPVYIQGSFYALPRKRFWPRLTKITVYYDAPLIPQKIAIESIDRKEKLRVITEKIEERLQMLQQLSKTSTPLA